MIDHPSNLPPDVTVVTERKHEKWLRFFIGTFTLLLTIGLYLYRDQLADSFVTSYWGIFLISAIGNATVILPVPSFAVAFLASGTLNPLLIGILAGAGAAVGEMTGYLGGYSGKGVIDRRFHNIYISLKHHIDQRGFLVIFLLSVIPNPFFDIGGIIAGVSGMKWYNFLFATFIGKSIRMTIIALVGTFFI